MGYCMCLVYSSTVFVESRVEQIVDGDRLSRGPAFGVNCPASHWHVLCSYKTGSKLIRSFRRPSRYFEIPFRPSSSLYDRWLPPKLVCYPRAWLRPTCSWLVHETWKSREQCISHPVSSGSDILYRL